VILTILSGFVIALLLWFVIEGCFVVPNLCREWKKARRK
jgi:hypothetical protein